MSTPNDCEIIGWVDFDGKSVRSDGVDVAVDGKTFVWRGRKYPPGVYYLVRRGGREALVSEDLLDSACGGAADKERAAGGAVELTEEELELLKKLRDNRSRMHESLLSEREREIARRLAQTPYLWYFNGWLQLTKDGSNAIDEYERKKSESLVNEFLEGLQVEKYVLRDYIKKKRRVPLKAVAFLHGDRFITEMIREGLIAVKLEDGELYAFVEEEDEEEEEEDYDEDDEEFIDERWMYYTVKVKGSVRLDELLRAFRGIGGDRLFKSLKEKGLLVVEEVGGVEYVYAR